MSNDLLAWEPLNPNEIYKLFGNLNIQWWIAGGWAIDLFVGYQTRNHGDIDVEILRKDQLVIQEYLKTWDLYKTNQLGFRPWSIGEYLEIGVNDIWCRLTPDSPWSIQLMLLETKDGDWVYRRNQRIRGRLSTFGKKTTEGIPYLSPEIQLLYKAKKETLEKDERDFTVVIPLLSKGALEWLKESLFIQFPEGHEWITFIDKTLCNH